MAARAGEQAWKTGTFVCQVCNAKVRVKKGETIPKCPNGHTTYDERVAEPRKQKSMSTKVGHSRKTKQPARASRSRTAARGTKSGRTSSAKKAPKRSTSSTRRGTRSASGRSSPRRTTARRSTAKRSSRKSAR